MIVPFRNYLLQVGKRSSSLHFVTILAVKRNSLSSICMHFYDYDYGIGSIMLSYYYGVAIDEYCILYGTDKTAQAVI